MYVVVKLEIKKYIQVRNDVLIYIMFKVLTTIKKTRFLETLWKYPTDLNIFENEKTKVIR